MKIIESFLPIFQGFYGTIFEADEDNMIEDGKTWDDYNWDYKDYMTRVAKACCCTIEDQLKDFGITVTFQNVYSPREYNFSNDSINVAYHLEDDSFNKVLAYLLENKEAFTQHVKDNFTSYDGFMSFYSNDINTWFNEYLKEDNEKLTTLSGNVLEFILQNEDFNADELQSDVCSEMYVNGELKEIENDL